ncbi:MAG: alpha/beta hydrolase [Gammaproteobacteria bacterium]|nr:alpha/beta hydrolase [Gammaproteobacteria bacterium]MBU2280200.1 alpha/beta hydrolase [Gammaproteobacteria bacterium]
MSFFTTSDQQQLYYKDWGEGPLVVFIHGWPLSADSWDEIAMVVAASGYRTIAYDRRGFGRSSQPWRSYDYNRLADDLAELLIHVGAENTTLVGFSMGGGEVARYLSRYHGKLINKAVLISSILPFRLCTHDNPSGTPPEQFAKTAQAIKTDRAHFLQGFFKDFFGMSMLSQPVSYELLEAMRSIALQAGVNSTLGCLDAFSGTDFRSDLAAFTMPTLIIHGTDDKTVPIEASAHLTASAIGHATLLEYQNAPHGLFATHRERLLQDLLHFLHHSGSS